MFPCGRCIERFETILLTAMNTNHFYPPGFRFVPERPFPPYSFVPGLLPHPFNHPDGHSYGIEPSEVDPPDPDRWQESSDYLYGIDLFNHGYYWEAHEVWEGLWNADGRIGMTSDFIKSLIKFAAAGVKIRMGILQGAQIHAQRALQMYLSIAHQLESSESRYMGLRLSELIDDARSIMRLEIEPIDDDLSVQIVFPFTLHPA